MGKIWKIFLIVFLFFFTVSCSDDNPDDGFIDTDIIENKDEDLSSQDEINSDEEISDVDEIIDEPFDEDQPEESDDGNNSNENGDSDIDVAEDEEVTVDEDQQEIPDESAFLENWEMYLTVDNMFDVYFGTPRKTTGEVVGRGDNWTKEYFFKAEGRQKTDYMYVATASDHSTAQGFIGTFKNLSRNKVTNTGDSVWEVFPAGAYEETNPYWPNPWPARLMPTQEEVDKAIAFAEANDLWVKPVGPEGYDNDPATPITPGTREWGTQAYQNIPKNARWIWHESGKCGSAGWVTPLSQCNHDEFLIFRVPGLIQM